MNAVWAFDFMRHRLYSGRVFRTLNVVDEARGIDIAVSIPTARAIALLTRMIDLHGQTSHSLRQRSRTDQPELR